MNTNEGATAPIDDGGPAFPIPPCGTGDPRDGMTTGSDGISIRDYFAAKAMQGMLASDSEDKISAWQNPEKAAAWAYQFADAMIARRAKP